MGLLNFFRRKPQSKVFRYFDGIRERGIDPIVVMRNLSSHPVFNFQVHPELSNLAPAEGATPAEVKQTMQIAAEATKVCVEAAREVFGLKPYDSVTDSGLTEGQALEVLDAFCEWFESLKKATAGRVTS